VTKVYRKRSKKTGKESREQKTRHLDLTDVPLASDDRRISVGEGIRQSKGKGSGPRKGENDKSRRGEGGLAINLLQHREGIKQSQRTGCEKAGGREKSDQDEKKIA